MPEVSCLAATSYNLAHTMTLGTYLQDETAQLQWVIVDYKDHRRVEVHGNSN